MSAANPVVAKTTQALAATNKVVALNTTEYDAVLLVVTGTFGAGESITVNVMDSDSVVQPVFNTTTGVAYTITQGTNTTVILPGGFLYYIGKTATVNPVGVDFIGKPRIGGGAS